MEAVAREVQLHEVRQAAEGGGGDLVNLEEEKKNDLVNLPGEKEDLVNFEVDLVKNGQRSRESCRFLEKVTRILCKYCHVSKLPESCIYCCNFTARKQI